LQYEVLPPIIKPHQPEKKCQDPNLCEPGREPTGRRCGQCAKKSYAHQSSLAKEQRKGDPQNEEMVFSDVAKGEIET